MAMIPAPKLRCRQAKTAIAICLILGVFWSWATRLSPDNFWSEHCSTVAFASLCNRYFNNRRATTFRRLGHGSGQISYVASMKVSDQDDVPALAQNKSSAAGEADWRAFRAQLVRQEMAPGKEEKNATEGWAYATPLIEQGSILLSAPSDHFAIHQQYFHKNVIFLVEHQDHFTKGVILNRPTAFSTHDLDAAVEDFVEEGVDDWNVWCGGDCQGINDRGTQQAVEYSVLHGLEHLAGESQVVIPGVYLIKLAAAKSAVDSGKADKDDFLLLVGYCGWGPGQLQSELDRGDSWTMAAADPCSVLGELRTVQTSLRERIAKATKGQIFTAREVGDGLDMWERLYSALGSDFQANLITFKSTGDSEHTDEMLRRWIDRCLIPSRYSSENIVTSGFVTSGKLRGGVILRGSPTAWLLGRPAESALFDSRRFAPGQYFHKSVALLVRDVGEDDPALVMLLNGPVIGEDANGEVLWGGPANSGEIRMDGGQHSLRVRGVTVLLPGTLELLLELGAFEIVDGVDIQAVLAAPPQERWHMTGGSISSIVEAQTSQFADVQRAKWFKRFLNVDV